MDAEINVGNVRYVLSAPDNDHIGQAFRHGTPYEHDLLKVLELFVSPGSVVVDAGANVGNHTVYFAARCGAIVHAFEPNPESSMWLDRNVQQNGLDRQVVIHREALGKSRGTARLVSDEHGLPTVKAVVDDEGDVLVLALDDLGLAASAVLKIDVEGAEENVLRGAKELIGTSRPVIAVEIQTGDRRARIDRVLREQGYRRFPISFAATPTWIYLPSIRATLRVFMQVGVLRRIAWKIKSHIGKGIRLIWFRMSSNRQ